MKPKRLISLLVAVCMMITMLPLSAVTAFAADTAPSTVYGTANYGNYAYDYTINTKDGTATITKFRVLVDGFYDIDIPETLGGFPVTAIGNAAFQGYSALKNVTIPDSVTSIGTLAFSNLSNLTTLSLGKGIKTIGDYAFFYLQSSAECHHSTKRHFHRLSCLCSLRHAYAYHQGSYRVDGKPCLCILLRSGIHYAPCWIYFSRRQSERMSGWMCLLLQRRRGRRKSSA